MLKLVSKLVQKLKNNLFTRMIACSMVAFTISVALYTILISAGYSTLARSDASSYQVTLLGLPIYEIAKSGNGLTGHAVGANMPIIGIVCSCVLMLVTELILTLKAKNKKSSTGKSTKG